MTDDSPPPAIAAARNTGLIPESLPDSFALNTSRLLLRPPIQSDQEPLCLAIDASLAELQRWLPWCQGGYSREACRDWIRSAIEGWRASREFSFVIFDRESDDLIGSIGLNRVDVLGRWANLGYWLHTDRTGNGLTSAAASAVVRFGFDVLGLQRIEIFADVENRASRRVAQKIGATFEGIARNRAPVAGINHDAAVYSLIPGDV